MKPSEKVPLVPKSQNPSLGHRDVDVIAMNDVGLLNSFNGENSLVLMTLCQVNCPKSSFAQQCDKFKVLKPGSLGVFNDLEVKLTVGNLRLELDFVHNILFPVGHKLFPEINFQFIDKGF